LLAEDRVGVVARAARDAGRPGHGRVGRLLAGALLFAGFLLLADDLLLADFLRGSRGLGRAGGLGGRRGLAALLLLVRPLGGRLPVVLAVDEACADEAIHHDRLHLLPAGLRLLVEDAQEALGLGAVLGDDGLVVLLADLADAPLELQVLERAEDGALLL